MEEKMKIKQFTNINKINHNADIVYIVKYQ